MPFGLQNACATYGRMLHLLLDGMQQTDNFVDDVISFTDGRMQHLQELRELFERVHGAGLTVKPSKCYFGYRQVDFVGHTVGHGSLRTMDDKVERIVQAPVPKTKTQLRSFLGLAGYYCQSVPSYATVAAPLTDLLRKGAPNNYMECSSRISFSAAEGYASFAACVKVARSIQAVSVMD